MAAQVLSFFQRSPRYRPAPAQDWTQQELAEFYRVESALMRAGIRVGTDRGLSDENEPWFVFYRADDGEVVIHFARIDGEYLIAGPAYEEIARGLDFTALVRNMVARHPLIRRSENSSNLSIHPAALLVAVVGTAFFKTGEARAAETGATNAPSGHARAALLTSSSNAGLTNSVAPVGFQQPTYDSVQVPANQAVLILAAALLASDYGVDADSLDASARTAISAAAASLDFGNAGSAPQGHEAAVVLTPPPHATVADNTPAQTVSSVLSLVAILSSMPQSEAATTNVLIGGGGGNGGNGGGNGGGEFTNHDGGSSPLSAPANDTANWAIEVRLNHYDAHVVDAVQLVRGAVSEGNLQKISVIEVQKLPDVLAKIIAQGDHYNVVTHTPQPETPADVSAPPPSGSGGDTAPVTGAQPDPIDTPVTPTKPGAPPPASYTYTGFATVDMVRSFIDYFVAHTSDVEIMTQGREITMYDSRVMTDPGAIDHMTSLTFHFFDGSSLNLVGNQSSFLHDGVLS